MTLLGTDEGGGPAASPIRAQRWLRAWHATGGGITIDKDGNVWPWRMLDRGKADDQRHLLRELEETPGLPAAVRVVIATAARRIFNRALRDMGRES